MLGIQRKVENTGAWTHLSRNRSGDFIYVTCSACVFLLRFSLSRLSLPETWNHSFCPSSVSLSQQWLNRSSCSPFTWMWNHHKHRNAAAAAPGLCTLWLHSSLKLCDVALLMPLMPLDYEEIKSHRDLLDFQSQSLFGIWVQFFIFYNQIVPVAVLVFRLVWWGVYCLWESWGCNPELLLFVLASPFVLFLQMVCFFFKCAARTLVMPGGHWSAIVSQDWSALHRHIVHFLQTHQHVTAELTLFSPEELLFLGFMLVIPSERRRISSSYRCSLLLRSTVTELRCGVVKLHKTTIILYNIT